MALKTIKAQVTFQPGLGGRQCASLVSLFKGLETGIHLRRWKSEQWIDGHSIMSLMMLALNYDAIVEIAVDESFYSDLQEALSDRNDLVRLLSNEDLQRIERAELEVSKKAERLVVHAVNSVTFSLPAQPTPEFGWRASSI